MIGGSPSLRRSRLIVTLTTAENGSAASSQARASSSSVETTLPACGQQQLEHRELLGARSSRRPARWAIAPAGVQGQVAAAHHRRQRRLRAPRQRPDARDQFGERERLRQVVVGAEAEARDPVLDPGRRGQHQHPGPSPLLDQRLAHPVAVHLGQVAIEHDHVVVVDRGLPQPGRAVERDVDRHALALQPERDRLGQLRLILDHQHAHSPCQKCGGSPPDAGRQDVRRQVTQR